MAKRKFGFVNSAINKDRNTFDEGKMKVKVK